MCLRNKVLKTLGYVRNFTYLGAANITSKQKSDMAKVAIKNMNITFSVEFITLWTFFQGWALKNLPNLYWVNVEVAESILLWKCFCGYHISPLVWVGDFMTMQEPRTPENPHING